MINEIRRTVVNENVPADWESWPIIETEEWHSQQRYDAPEEYGTVTYRKRDGLVLADELATLPQDYLDPMDGTLERAAGTTRHVWIFTTEEYYQCLAPNPPRYS